MEDNIKEGIKNYNIEFIKSESVKKNNAILLYNIKDDFIIDVIKEVLKFAGNIQKDTLEWKEQ